MRITIIGSGNVATHLAAAFKNAGHRIIQVYSRDIQNASLLAYHVGAVATDDIELISPETDIFIIAVNDGAIGPLAKALSAYQKLTVHTSGATDLEVILQYNPLAGVLYPLQTLSKNSELNFSTVPLCIEGNDENLTLLLEQLAATVSENIYRVSSAQRKILHLAAVFACNFPNHLYAVAAEILARHQLDFNLLRPLIAETAQKVKQNLPGQVQTGPAVRNDETTMASHLNLLEQQPQLQELYEVLSQSIIKMENAKHGNK